MLQTVYKGNKTLDCAITRSQKIEEKKRRKEQSDTTDPPVSTETSRQAECIFWGSLLFCLMVFCMETRFVARHNRFSRVCKINIT